MALEIFLALCAWSYMRHWAARYRHEDLYEYDSKGHLYAALRALIP